MGVVDIPNDKLFKKNAKKFQKNLSKLFYENDDLIAKLNESNSSIGSTEVVKAFKISSSSLSESSLGSVSLKVATSALLFPMLLRYVGHSCFM